MGNMRMFIVKRLEPMHLSTGLSSVQLDVELRSISATRALTGRTDGRRGQQDYKSDRTAARPAGGDHLVSNKIVAPRQERSNEFLRGATSNGWQPAR